MTNDVKVQHKPAMTKLKQKITHTKPNNQPIDSDYAWYFLYQCLYEWS